MTELQESVERARYVREKGQPPWPVDACRIVDAYLELLTVAQVLKTENLEWQRVAKEFYNK